MKMFLKRKNVFMYVFILFLLLLTAGFSLGRTFTVNSTHYIFQVERTQPVTSDYKLPLPKPSDITVEEDDLRLDLERITVNKYFIIYSVIYGDQSHTSYHLYLTDLNKDDLNPDKIGDIWLETANNEKIYPVATKPVIREFPEDQPLGWKLSITVKFPYLKTREKHVLVLNYNEKLLKLNNIEY